MRYALRNQDKIAAAYSRDYLQQHILQSLDSAFEITPTESIEEALSLGFQPTQELQMCRIFFVNNSDMDPKTFFTKVALMRKLQKEYSGHAHKRRCAKARLLNRKSTERLSVSITS
ncbi:MAG: hypothetical protein Q4D56_06210 [Bacteroides sp.]|nr:hypothetical protein [Bacteroides sp.]